MTWTKTFLCRTTKKMKGRMLENLSVLNQVKNRFQGYLKIHHKILEKERNPASLRKTDSICPTTSIKKNNKRSTKTLIKAASLRKKKIDQSLSCKNQLHQRTSRVQVSDPIPHQHHLEQAVTKTSKLLVPKKEEAQANL